MLTSVSSISLIVFIAAIVLLFLYSIITNIFGVDGPAKERILTPVSKLVKFVAVVAILAFIVAESIMFFGGFFSQRGQPESVSALTFVSFIALAVAFGAIALFIVCFFCIVISALAGNPMKVQMFKSFSLLPLKAASLAFLVFIVTKVIMLFST